MLFKTLKANASRQVLAVLAIGALLPFPALAQKAETPVFIPANAWQVGANQLSSVRGLAPMKMPCVLSNEFDNGFVVRFSGGGQKMLAMAVDFRQNVFVQGRKYDAMISIGDSYVKQVSATSFTPSTLIFNLRPLPDFYQAIQKGQAMEVEIDNNVMKFTLGKLAAAYPALENCFAGKETPVIASLNDSNGPMGDASAPVTPVQQEQLADVAPAPILPPAIAAKPLPKSMDDILKAAPSEAPTPTQIAAIPAQGKMQVSQVTPRSPEAPVAESAANAALSQPKVSRLADTADGSAITPLPGAAKAAPTQNAAAMAGAKPISLMPVSQPVAVAASKVWDAKAGEDMKIVLSRWAERAGYDLQWQSDQDGKVAQDISLSGNFEDAVSQLLAENSAASGIAGHVQTMDGGKKDLAPKVADAISMPQPKPATKASIPALRDDWKAPANSNIQTILNQWGDKAGVTVVWQSYMNIPLKKKVNVSGTFEEAVQSLLDQYANDSERPVGQLNIDPETGVRTLLMNMDSHG